MRMRPYRRPLIAASGGLLMVLVVSALWVLCAPRPLHDFAAFTETGSAQHGRDILVASHCASCHASPGQSDRLRLGGGLALASKFGTLRVPNISPDPDSGIGRWRVQDLANALLRGVAPNGTHYYPAFPYTSFTHLSAADVSDLWAYLRTLPAIAGRPPAHDLSFPFNIRRLVGFWKLLYFRPGPLTRDSEHSDLWKRGRYLVETQSHCAECHSSRNALAAIRPSTRYAGGPDPEGVGFVPNITPACMGHWSTAQWVRFFRTGETPDLRVVGSSMADVLTDTAMQPASDQEAMTVYLMSLPPRSTSRTLSSRRCALEVAR